MPFSYNYPLCKLCVTFVHLQSSLRKRGGQITKWDIELEMVQKGLG